MPVATHKEFIGLMAAMMSIVAISIDAMLPALGIIGEQFGVSHPNQAQLVISFIFCGMAIGQLICGPLSDALGRKRLLYGTIALYLTGTVLCIAATSLPELLAGRFVQGLGVAGPYVSTLSIVRDRYNGPAMARIMSLVMMIFITVPALAPSIGQAILYFSQWQSIFVFFLIYALVVLVWVTLRLPETLPVGNRVPFRIANLATGAREVLSHRGTRNYMLCAGCVFGALIGYLNSCLQVFHELYQVGQYFALYFGGLAVIFGFSSLCNSRLVQRFGMQPICTAAFVFMLGATAVMLIAHRFATPNLLAFLIYASVLFASFGLIFGNINALAMEPMGHIAGTASAIIGATSSVISITAGTLIGQLYNHSLYPMLIGFTVLGALALFFMLNARSPSSEMPVSSASL